MKPNLMLADYLCKTTERGKDKLLIDEGGPMNLREPHGNRIRPLLQ